MKTLILNAVCGLVICQVNLSEGNTQQPNVIIVLADDMGYGDIGAHGNPIIKTPYYDALHAQSVRFTNFNVSPSCAPTRAALLTGKHEFRSGVTHTIRPMRNMSLEAFIIPQLFKAKGYATGMFGKWHLNLEGDYNPRNRGFDVALHCIADNYKQTHNSPTLVKNGIEAKYQGYRTDIIFDEAMAFIKANKERPFFLYLAPHSPHSPHKVPTKYSAPYEQYTTKYEGKKFGTGFFGQIANLDQNLGRLLQQLTELELDDNTLLIAMTDNGGTGGVDVYNAGRRGTKGTIWSGGTRAYSFWKWGNRFPVGDRPQMTGHIDVYPTLADICGLKIPEQVKAELEGDSLLPILKHAAAAFDGNRMQVHHVGRWPNPKTWPQQKYADCSVTWKNYALVRMDKRDPGKAYTSEPEIHHKLTHEAGVWELFDLEADPFQKNNIAGNHPEIVKRMADHYDAWWKKVEIVLTERWGN